MATIERTYTIPLRKEWLKKPKYKRTKRSVTTVRDFLAKHMKSDEVKLGPFLNKELWKHGIRNPPPRIKIIAKKDDKGLVTAELVGHEYVDKAKAKEAKPAAASADKKKEEQIAKLKQALGSKKEAPKEEKKARPAAEEKPKPDKTPVSKQPAEKPKQQTPASA